MHRCEPACRRGPKADQAVGSSVARFLVRDRVGVPVGTGASGNKSAEATESFWSAFLAFASSVDLRARLGLDDAGSTSGWGGLGTSAVSTFALRIRLGLVASAVPVIPGSRVGVGMGLGAAARR